MRLIVAERVQLDASSDIRQKTGRTFGPRIHVRVDKALTLLLARIIYY